MLTTLATAIWFQKIKALLDAVWAVSCLFCVPGVIVAAACSFIPQQSTGRALLDLHRLTQPPPAPHTYATAPGTGGPLAYRLGLFDSKGNLVHEYPDQIATANRNAQHGSIVIEVPEGVSKGDYVLRVFKKDQPRLRDVPINVEDGDDRH